MKLRGRFQLLFWIFSLSNGGFIEGIIVSDHLPREDPSLAGLVAMNGARRQRKRSLPLAKGSAFVVKWGLSFPARGVTPIRSSLQITHSVSIPLTKIYPEKEEARIDLNPINFYDHETWSEDVDDLKSHLPAISQGLHRMGLSSDLEDLRNNLIESGQFGDIESLVQNRSEIFHQELKYQESLKWDRRQSRHDRLIVYKDIQAFMDKMGLPGKSCLMRSICEVGEHPFKESLNGEILNILMMASLGGRPEFPDENNEYNDFVDAEIHGRNVGHCDMKYTECNTSIFFLLYSLTKDLFS